MVRLAILDVGSNTVHLLVVDAEPSARPAPAADHRWESPLLHHRDADGRITESGQRLLLAAVGEAHDNAVALGVTDLSAFATSALREATNVDQLLGRIRTTTGVDLQVLDGEDEARLTFLAARRWLGWGSGRLLLLDIGGGSLEVGLGVDEVPERVVSLPLGAARLTHDFLRHDPPRREELDSLAAHVDALLAADAREFDVRVDVTVGTSKTLRSLARLAGAAPSAEGLYVRRALRRDDAERLVAELSSLPVKERVKLPGVSVRRAPQLLAGAVVTAAAMRHLEIEELVICPWALREGVILRRHDWINSV